MEDRDELLVRAQTIIKELRGRLAEAERLRSEPVAIVGMACRFPGAPALRDRDLNGGLNTERNSARNADTDSNLEAFWRLTLAGCSVERPAPEGRWDGDAVTGPHGRGRFVAAFLKDIDLFDAAFFDIAPAEAMNMDPAQRLFLEVAWHALEDAGHTKQTLSDGDTGVFVGHTGLHEYLRQHLAAGAEVGIYTGTGSGEDVIAGRLAYILNLHGPAMTVNTACSSSLVAVHLARRSLLAGECRMAVAGGVNILGPVSTELAMQVGLMAADGRCKTFDERADGFGRGEGCGVLVLKRLSDAMVDGDLIRAVIHGSAVNQDGRTNGLTAPNGRAQVTLLRRALRDAGIAASQVGYVEAHGTGTSLGDLIEFGALAEVYGISEPDSLPCALGSAKANIGHQEGAAGIAGVIRAVLAIEHGVIPPLAGFRTLNSDISLEGTRLAIPVESTAWNGGYAARFASTSSFGWSGTNAHVVLGAAPATPAMLEPRLRPIPHVFQRSRHWIPMREGDASAKLAPDDWFYETVWKETPLPAALSEPCDQALHATEKWLIFADRTGVAEQLALAIAMRGSSYVLVRAGSGFRWNSEIEFQANAADRKQIDLVLHSKELANADRLFVVYLHALDLDMHRAQSTGADLPDVIGMEKCLNGLIQLCHGITERASGRTMRMWSVTRGAQTIHGHEVSLRLEQAPLHGFSSSAKLDYPDFWRGTIDLPPSDESAGGAGDFLLQECGVAANENAVLYRDKRRYVSRLRRAQAPPLAELRLNSDATYLVTGAFGGIGLDLAKWLAQSGAKRLVLLGRSGAGGDSAPETQTTLQTLKEAGVHVTVERCDVADLGQMSDMFARLHYDAPPIRGILHAAADVIWKPSDDLNAEDVRRSFQAKVRGSLVLHELTKQMALDFIVLFSSAAAAIGARNGAAYATGNSFMDALALEMRSAGVPAWSIQWGHWARRTVHSNAAEQQLTGSGMAAMSAKKALNALGCVLNNGTGASGLRQLMIAQIDVDRLKAAFATRTNSLFLSDLVSAQRANGRTRPAAIAALDGLPEAARIEGLTLLVAKQLRRAMDLDSSEPVDLTRGFFDMGMDSLQSIQFENFIETATGIVASTLVFLYPNVNALVKFLDDSLFVEETNQRVRKADSRNRPVEKDAPLSEAETRTALLAELELFKGVEHG